MNATLGKVAKHAGVAIDTARKVLRDDPSVRFYLRERVLKSAKDLDYQPNLLARALRGKSLNLVPISISDLSQLYFGGLASSISRCLVEIGMEPALCFNPLHLMRMCQSLSTSASILAAGFDEKTVRALVKHQKVVTIDSNLSDIAGVGNVSIDFGTAYAQIVDVLIGKGRKRIAIVSNHYHLCLKNNWFEPKFTVAMKRMADHKIRPVGPSKSPVFRTSKDLLKWYDAHPDTLDAILCENDILAAEVVADMAARRLKTPDDILVVGCDANCLIRGIWSLKLDTEWLATEAVSLLQRLMAGEKKIEASIYHPVLVDDQGVPVTA